MKEKPIKVKIEIEISKIKVDSSYYNFHYIVKINGKKNKSGECNSDHSWGNDIKGFTKTLKNGWAAHLVLDEIDFD